MQETLQLIKNKFQLINDKGWIESKRKGNTGVGYTLERLFEIEENNFEIPDFIIFELKTHLSCPESYITLFNATPDGDYLFEIERLKEKFGYPDKTIKQYKVLNCDLFSRQINNLGRSFKQTIKFDYNENKIRLHIMDNNLQLIDKEVSWSFELLKEKFERKLKYLAFVNADKKFFNGKVYYKYNKITFYKSYSFGKFIELLEKGKIRISLKIGVFKSGKNIGKTHDHGTSFSILEKDLCLLYEEISET